MLKFALPAVAALGLVACSAQSQATNPEVQAVPALVGWYLSREDHVAKLAYGVAHSDQLDLLMTCAPGQTQAALYGDVRPAGARLVRASTAPVAIDPLSGDLVEEAGVSLLDPVIQGLARTGSLAVSGEGGRFDLSATRQERRLIRDFLAYCASGSA